MTMRRITDIQELRGVQLDILDDIHAFCTANGIKYFLSCGTLIGAVRHKGYIPWDDDLDIYMPREDYERILDVVRQWQDQFMEEDLVLLFRRIDYDKIINDIVALPDYYVNTFWHEVVSRLRQRNKVGVKSLLRKSRPLVAALARDMATGAIINMLLGG